MEDLHEKQREEVQRGIEERLYTEINVLKQILVTIDRDKTQRLDSITENIKGISDILKTISENKLDIQNFWLKKPIHHLLSAGPFTRTEIPIDILVGLISAGFDVNAIGVQNRTCLDIAAENCHYNAVRLLVRHGAIGFADSQLSYWGKRSPIVLLASHSNVPLDLFDMLATPKNLNDNRCYKYLPLHEAVRCSNTETALHLIKLGASVNQRDAFVGLPLHYAVDSCLKQANNELFMSVLPPRSQGTLILQLISKLISTTERPAKTATHLFVMLHQLLQRLHFDEPLKVEICHSSSLRMMVMGAMIDPIAYYSHPVYLCSLILVELQFDLTSVPGNITNVLSNNARAEALIYAPAVEEVWKNCHQQNHVKSLLRLCILKTRSSMSSLDDDSFLSLPGPPYLRRLLTYRDVSERIFAEWCNGITVEWK